MPCSVLYIVERTPNGIRTRATALKGQRPRPLDDGGLLDIRTIDPVDDHDQHRGSGVRSPKRPGVPLSPAQKPFEGTPRRSADLGVEGRTEGSLTRRIRKKERQISQKIVGRTGRSRRKGSTKVRAGTQGRRNSTCSSAVSVTFRSRRSGSAGCPCPSRAGPTAGVRSPPSTPPWTRA